MPALSTTPLLRGLCLLLAVLIAVELFHVGAQPVATGLFAAPWDKLAHLLVYSAVTLLLWVGTAGRMPALIVAIVVAIGALDELHQTLLPGRSADALDFMVDAAAAAATAWILLLYESRRKECNP